MDSIVPISGLQNQTGMLKSKPTNQRQQNTHIYLIFLTANVCTFKRVRDIILLKGTPCLSLSPSLVRQTTKKTGPFKSTHVCEFPKEGWSEPQGVKFHRKCYKRRGNKREHVMLLHGSEECCGSLGWAFEHVLQHS